MCLRFSFADSPGLDVKRACVISVEQLLTIELFGQPYTFKADEDFDRAKEIADLIVKEVERVEIALGVPSSGVKKVAVLLLATLNIAYENHELKKKQASLCQTVSTRLKNLLDLLGDRLSVSELGSDVDRV